MATFLLFSGSTRKESFNQKVLNNVETALLALGASVTAINLLDYPQAIYNGDDEAANGLPESTLKFKRLLNEHDALVIGCPEYNGYMTPLLLNTLDWATRSTESSPDKSGFTEKPVLITGTSPGPSGGTRAAAQLRTFLSGIGCIVSEDTLSVPSGFQAFDSAGKLNDEAMQKRLDEIVSQFNADTLKLAH